VNRIKDIIVLAGGLGIRLRPISENTPKVLVPVAEDRVFLDYILSWLAKSQVKRVILSLHYRYEQFQLYIARHTFPFTVEMVVEPSLLGTGGAVRHVLEQKDVGESFGVLNGDTYLNFGLKYMVEQFERLQDGCIVGLSYVEDTSRYGKVHTCDSKVMAFEEKDSSGGAGWVNNGCYILTRDIFTSCPNKFSLEKELFPRLIEEGKLYGYKAAGEFIDIGVPEDYHRFIRLYG